MLKLKIYATVLARCIILFLGLIAAAFFFLLYVILQIADIYLRNFAVYIDHTKELLYAYSEQLENKQQ
jgi:hypothetical protein